MLRFLKLLLLVAFLSILMQYFIAFGQTQSRSSSEAPGALPPSTGTNTGADVNTDIGITGERQSRPISPEDTFAAGSQDTFAPTPSEPFSSFPTETFPDRTGSTIQDPNQIQSPPTFGGEVLPEVQGSFSQTCPCPCPNIE